MQMVMLGICWGSSIRTPRAKGVADGSFQQQLNNQRNYFFVLFFYQGKLCFITFLNRIEQLNLNPSHRYFIHRSCSSFKINIIAQFSPPSLIRLDLNRNHKNHYYAAIQAGTRAVVNVAVIQGFDCNTIISLNNWIKELNINFSVCNLNITQDLLKAQFFQ